LLSGNSSGKSAFLASRPAARNFRAADTTQVRPCLHRESDRPDQDVADTALLQLGQDGEPELGALAALEPESQDVALTVHVDADRHVAGEVADGAAVADLHDQRVEEEDRVDVLERSGLRLADVVEQ